MEPRRVGRGGRVGEGGDEERAEQRNRSEGEAAEEFHHPYGRRAARRALCQRADLDARRGTAGADRVLGPTLP